jgi:zinc D-Ala-D-Ala dipeptidase
MQHMAIPLRPALAFALLAALPAAARERLPAGFVYLRDVAPQVAQEIRYATSNNFTGAPLPGYAAGECVLRRDAALALARVAQDLARQNLGLKTYDCYRPARAVAAMWRWAHDGARDGDKRFYPNVDKLKLFSLGYIAAHSRHSTGTAVDLTLIRLPAAAPPAPAADGPCTAPAPRRAADAAPGVPLDMGTGFDCLDVKSYTRSGAVTQAARRARETLRAAMAAHGFRNYFREWWHYEFTGGAAPRAHDFPIEGR